MDSKILRKLIKNQLAIEIEISKWNSAHEWVNGKVFVIVMQYPKYSLYITFFHNNELNS